VDAVIPAALILVVTPQTPRTFEAYRARASELIEAEDFPDLEAMALDYITAFPQELEPQADLGLALYHQERYGEAVSTYREAVRPGCDRPQWWMGLGLSVAKATWNRQPFPVKESGAEAEIAECGRRAEALNDALALNCYRNPEVWSAAAQADDPSAKLVPMDFVDIRGHLPSSSAGTGRGEVFLDALFTKDGDVARVFVLAGPPALRPAAETWTRPWHFHPWKPGGHAEPFHLILRASFNG
jgi:hypothetical protein